MSTCTEKITSNDYVDLIVDYQMELNGEENACYQKVDDQYSILYLPRKQQPGREIEFYGYSITPKLYGLMANGTESFESTGSYRVQSPPLSLTGRGVLLAFVDTGIDYRNPIFRREDGTTRILSLWDQTMETGAEQAEDIRPFPYGTVYTRADIDRAFAAENPYDIVPSRDENGHGSAMAGAAAGAMLGTAPGVAITGGGFRGAAPDAELIIVKLKQAKPYLRELYLIPEDVPAYQENDLMLAIAYVERFAIAFQRPVVLCIGIGTNQGDHTGQSHLSQYLDTVAKKRGMAVVICGGNEGNAAHHYRGELVQRDYGIPPFINQVGETMEIRVAEDCRGFCMELWGTAPDVYTVSIRTPGGEQTPVIRYGIRRHVEYSFIYEKSSVAVDSLLSEGNLGEELLFFRFVNPTPGIWIVQVHSVEQPQIGVFHTWLPIRDFLNVPVYFLKPNPYTTLTEPGMADVPVTVSTYDAVNNSFYINSGRGFTQTAGINPQLSAPGVGVATGVGETTGSGMAAAVAAGIFAQFMQWAVVEGNVPLIESRQLKSVFIRGAEREQDVTYPNREWGYGRINIEGAFRVLSNS